MKRSLSKHILALTAATALSALPMTAMAQTASSNTSTGVTTGVNTSADSGVNIGAGTRINGGIRTGDSTARSNVRTDVDTDVNTTASRTRMDRDRDWNRDGDRDRDGRHVYGRARAGADVTADNRGVDPRDRGRGNKYGLYKDRNKSGKNR